MSAARPAGASLLAALALVMAAVAPARAADPAEAALRASDAYVSPGALGPAAPQAEGELRAAAARLAGDGRPVKLAVVAGPAGAPSMRDYARRLAEALGYRGTLVVTAPRRAVIAVGPLAPAVITRRLRAEGVGSIANPVDRVVRAAGLAAPAPVVDEGSGAREALILLGLAALGAAWAVAWGSRREAQRARERMLEARAALVVRLDALGARATALRDRPDLPAAAGEEVEAALATRAETSATLRGARTDADVLRLAAPVRDALGAVERAAAAVGEDHPAADPFDGLCAIDPAHGPASARAVPAGEDDPIPACRACRADAEAGRPPARRMLPSRGRPVPFADVELPEAAAAGARAPRPPRPGGTPT